MNKQVYYNGIILTMENPSHVEAIYVNNGIIEKVGTAREMLKYKKTDTQMIDLEGKTLMPAFIDAYGHLLTFAKSLKTTQTNESPKAGSKWHIVEKEMSKWICAAQNIYLSQGITTAQEGLVGPVEWNDLKFMADKKLLNIDVIGYVDFKNNYSLLHKSHKYTKQFIHRLKLGDYYLKQLRYSVASQVSPLKTATLPNMLHVVWYAVNCVTKLGHRLGETESITPLEALQAVTLQAAYQCFEEQKKGSLKEGKLADLVVLDKNPLMISSQQIKEIKVLQTIKEGKIVYTHPEYNKKAKGI